MLAWSPAKVIAKTLSGERVAAILAANFVGAPASLAADIALSFIWAFASGLPLKLWLGVAAALWGGLTLLDALHLGENIPGVSVLAKGQDATRGQSPLAISAPIQGQKLRFPKDETVSP